MKRIGKINKILAFLFIILFSLYSFSHASEPVIQLTWPIDCRIDQDCWVVNYVDVVPAIKSVRDFSCGPRSYDNHKGTDIAIRDWHAMESGVDVLAAADGKVLRFRDDVEDKVLSRVQLNKLKEENKSCGNGIFVEHANGWNTIYCHLKKNSIVVKSDQTVKAGQKLGQVGHSGYVEFAHLHIGVKHNDILIDPYTGLSNQDGCGELTQEQSLWEEKKYSNYSPVSIYAAGFSNAVPSFEQIKQNASSPDSLSVESPALTFWVSIFGVEKGDQITMEIRDPEKRIFSQKTTVQEKTRARQFLYIGKKNRNGVLEKGNYEGIVFLARRLPNGKTIKQSIKKGLVIR